MVKKVFERPLSWLERILFLDFIKGLSITIRHAFRRTITTHYPYEKLTPPKRFRGFFGHKVVDGKEPQPAFDEWVERFKIKVEPGRSRCVVCMLCKRARIPTIVSPFYLRQIYGVFIPKPLPLVVVYPYSIWFLFPSPLPVSSYSF